MMVIHCQANLKKAAEIIVEELMDDEISSGEAFEKGQNINLYMNLKSNMDKCSKLLEEVDCFYNLSSPNEPSEYVLKQCYEHLLFNELESFRKHNEMATLKTIEIIKKYDKCKILDIGIGKANEEKMFQNGFIEARQNGEDQI